MKTTLLLSIVCFSFLSHSADAQGINNQVTYTGNRQTNSYNQPVLNTLITGNEQHSNSHGGINAYVTRNANANRDNGRHNGHYNDRDNNYSYQQPCAPVAMCNAEFSELENCINNAWFESGKLTIAKQALASNYVSTCQVKELMNLFSFESSKLEIAEFAYCKVVDPNHYYQVNDAFSFSSSICQLNSYLNNHNGYAYR